MTTRTLQSTINAAFKANGFNAKKFAALDFAKVADNVSRWVRYEELPSECETAAYGIMWALQTGRLDGRLHIAIERNLKGREATALLAAVATSCKSIGEVPCWLIANADVIA